MRSWAVRTQGRHTDTLQMHAIQGVEWTWDWGTSSSISFGTTGTISVQHITSRSNAQPHTQSQSHTQSHLQSAAAASTSQPATASYTSSPSVHTRIQLDSARTRLCKEHTRGRHNTTRHNTRKRYTPHKTASIRTTTTLSLSSSNSLQASTCTEEETSITRRRQLRFNTTNRKHERHLHLSSALRTHNTSTPHSYYCKSGRREGKGRHKHGADERRERKDTHSLLQKKRKKGKIPSSKPKQ